MKKRKILHENFDKDSFKKYFFWAIVAVLIVLSYLILKSYFVALISAFILSYLVRPTHVFLKKRIGNIVSAVVLIILLIVVLIVPFVLVIGGVVGEVYSYIGGRGLSGVLSSVSSSLPEKLSFYLIGLSDKGVGIIGELIGSAASYLPNVLISLFVTIFGMFYFLTNWDNLAESLKNYIPFGDRGKVAKDISNVTNVLVYGTLLIAVIEFFVAALGFYFSGISFYLLLAALVFFFAFIPGLGPAIVWAPLGIYYIAIGDYFSFAIILVTGLILSVGIDFFLRSKILGGMAKLNPLLMLIGILGGVSVFGIFGFIIGPLILIYTIKLLEEGLIGK